MYTIRELGQKETLSEASGKRLQSALEASQSSRWVPADFLEKHPRVRVQMAGLGDVGQNVAIGLTLLGGEKISEIGLYDLNTAQVERMVTELSQFSTPPGGSPLPRVCAAEEQRLFDCDLFLFCATKAVPALGSEVRDVRMAQYEANRKIVAIYGRMAAERNYQGLFLVISDPVDLLTMEAFRSAPGLHPYQFRGCGLGVMNARGRYFAAKEERFADYLQEGRAFGPHGQDLVLANSLDPEKYDDKKSQELTRLAVGANLQVRALGFKPYLAPAMSSAVFTILALLRGEWNYSAAYLNGIYFGALNRWGTEGVEWERTPVPGPLWSRLEKAYMNLEAILWKSF